MRRLGLSQGKFALVDDGDFQWLNQWKWSYDGNKYATRNIYIPKGKNKAIKVKMHRLILGAKKGEQVDHINGDKLDNRRSNLRIATPGQNAINWKRNPSSGFRGVYKQKYGYIAEICVSGVTKYLGFFTDKAEAAKAYNAAAKIYHKEFAVINNI